MVIAIVPAAGSGNRMQASRNKLFLPLESESIIIDKESNILRMIQKIRDEAHRFAITFNRDSRIKASKKNILEELP